MDKIIINKEYFDNIGTAINSINDFISSNFTKKNFPNVEDDVQLDGTLLGILSWLNNVDPELVQDSSKLNDMIEDISSHSDKFNGPDVMSQLPEDLANKVYAVIGCKALEFISNNFEDFEKLVNGIYTFELFTNPSKYADEERRMLHFLKRGRKMMNAGELKEPRLSLFKELLVLSEQYKRVNQWK